MPNFIVKALLAGIGIAIMSGPIGSLMVWRRMAYLGDTLAHATLFGVTIATFLHINIYYGLIATCLLIATILNIVTNDKRLANDTILSILSNSILALGLIFSTLLSNTKLDLISYLFGDLLSITNIDLIWIFCVDLLVISTLFFLWDKLVFITINKELAITEGIPEAKIKWIFILMLALIFAITIRLVGILLINALLIIPCSSAKIWAKSPSQMAILGSFFGCIAIILGMLSSFYLDLPTGPAIVVSATLLLLCNTFLRRILNF